MSDFSPSFFLQPHLLGLVNHAHFLNMLARMRAYVISLLPLDSFSPFCSLPLTVWDKAMSWDSGLGATVLMLFILVSCLDSMFQLISTIWFCAFCLFHFFCFFLSPPLSISFKCCVCVAGGLFIARACFIFCKIYIPQGLLSVLNEMNKLTWNAYPVPNTE